MKLEKLKLYIQSLKEDKNESAFTLIELIVVMAILAILVLLAAPQFLGYTEKAKVAHIQNDTAVVEGVINEGLVLDTIEIKDFLDEGAVSNEILTKAYNDGKLYGKGGRLNEVEGFNITDISGKEFIAVTPGLLDKTNSQLDGVFYADEDGNVLYLDEGAPQGGSESETEDEVVTKDTVMHEDRNYGGYDIGLGDEGIAWVNEMYEQDYVMAEDGHYKWEWNMFWLYTGDKNKVIIPMYINENLVTSHFGMFRQFSESNKLSVASNNSNVKNTQEMFDGSSVTKLDLSEYDTSNVTNMTQMFANTNVTELDLSGFDIGNVTEMYEMFSWSDIERVIVSTEEIATTLRTQTNAPGTITFTAINN